MGINIYIDIKNPFTPEQAPMAHMPPIDETVRFRERGSWGLDKRCDKESLGSPQLMSSFYLEKTHKNAQRAYFARSLSLEGVFFRLCKMKMKNAFEPA